MILHYNHTNVFIAINEPLQTPTNVRLAGITMPNDTYGQ